MTRDCVLIPRNARERNRGHPYDFPLVVTTFEEDAPPKARLPLKKQITHGYSDGNVHKGSTAAEQPEEPLPTQIRNVPIINLSEVVESERTEPDAYC